MEANRGDIVIEGLDLIIIRDLDKHKALLERNIIELQAISAARSTEIERKKFYKTQIGERNYNDKAMAIAIGQMSVNITKYSSTIAGLQDAKAFNTNIVDTLTKQLAEYYVNIRKLDNLN